MLIAAALALALSAKPASAQFFAPETFFAAASAGGTNGHLSVPDPHAPWRVTVGGQTGEIVRTVRGGEHIGDLFGGSRTLSVAGHGLDLFSAAASQSGTLTDSGGRRTDGSQHTGELRLRGTLPLRWGRVFGGWERADSRLDAQSDALNKLVPIFSGRPDLRWRFRRTAGVLGLEQRVGGATVAGSVSRFDALGTLTLTQNNTTVLLPLSYQGAAWHLDAHLPLRASASALLWTDRSDGSSGKETATRDGESLGGAATTRATVRAVGAAWERGYHAGAETVTFFHSQRWARFATIGGGLRAKSLGYTDIDRAGYDLAIALDRRETGVTWARSLPHRRALTLDYRWIESPIVVDYGASGQRFLFGYRTGDEWSSRNARAHRVGVRYSLPLGESASAPRVTIDGSQLIPLSIQSRTASAKTNNSGGNGSDTPGEARHVRGGWQVGFFVTQRF